MSEEPRGEKTLPASPTKRGRAREDGNIAKSQDLTAAIGLGVALGALLLMGPFMMSAMVGATRYFIGEADRLTLSHTGVSNLAMDLMFWLALGVLPFMLLMMLTGILANLLQVGFLFTTKPLMPKFNRLNPITGMKKFVSLRALVELVKSLAKLTVVAIVVWIYLRDKNEEFIALMQLPPYAMAAGVGTIVFGVWWRIVLSIFLIGIADYGFQYWQREQDLRMTQEEARQESKELEGDPQVKRRIRQLQRQMATQRMMKEVPGADVIITNPTHYAVALLYDVAAMAAPVVVAKGERLVAERIRDIAIQNDVPIVQRPELARTLFRTIEVGQPIPESLFRAVAEVLAFVYRIDKRAEKARERARMAV